MKNETCLRIIVLLFVFLFIYAAVSKVIEYQEFEAQLGKSPLIMRFSSLVAPSVPLLEVGIAFLLLFPRTLLIGLFAFYTLMLIFTGYISFILLFSPFVPCSCGGILNSLGWTEHLIFNAVFVLLSIVAVALHYRIGMMATSNPYKTVLS